MKTVQDVLRSYFMAGGAGTNAKLAKLAKCTEGAVRKAISRLRDEGVPIERPVFAFRTGSKAVYRLADGYYTRVSPTPYQDRRKGRPALTQTLV